MRALIPALVFVATLAAWADDAARGGRDPEGTTPLALEVGQRCQVGSEPGTTILCDDRSVAIGEFSDDGNAFLIHALKPGTTLCGVWLANAAPRGLYRVVVTAATDAGDPAQDKVGEPVAPAAGDTAAPGAAGPDATPDAGTPNAGTDARKRSHERDAGT